MNALITALECERTQVCPCIAPAISQHNFGSPPARFCLHPLQGVRTSIVETLPLSDTTLATLLERTRDISSEVRAAVYRRLQQQPVNVIRCELHVTVHLCLAHQSANPMGPVVFAFVHNSSPRYAH